MTHRYRIPNRSKLATSRIRTALRRLRASLLDPATATLTDAIRGIFAITASFLPKIGRPLFDPKYLSEDGDPNPDAWNENLDSIEEDLRLLFEEIEEVRQLRAEVSNAATVSSKELEEKANLAQSLLTDLRLTNGQLDQEVIVATDNFLDSTKIDSDFPLQFPLAEVNTSQGAVTLKRTQAISVITDGATVNVTPIAPDVLVSRPDQGRMPTPDGTMRFYEGRFYAPLGQARPEGGRWHLEEKVRPGVTVPGDSTIFTMNDEAGEGIFDQFPDLRREGESRPQGFPLSPEDIVVIDRGAPLSELQAGRKQLVDGSPDTFAECEFVVDSKPLDQLIEDREAEEANVTPQELRARAAKEDIDKFDFEAEIVIRLDRRQLVNFLTINPMNFDETAWLEVIEVSTAQSEEDAYVPIEGFDDQLFENVLTDAANAELTDGEAKTVLAPSKYAYRGQGVYSFSPREVSRIRIRLRQRTPVPSEYERIVIQLTRTLSATESSFKGSCFPASTLIDLPYSKKRISDIKVGDIVCSYRRFTQTVTFRRVTKVLVHKPARLYRVGFAGGAIRATGNHKLMTNHGWRKVKNLKPGSCVVGLVNGTEFMATVTSVGIDDVEPVYNLYTEGEHNYIADGVLAHNFTTFTHLRTLWHRIFRDGRDHG